MQCFLVELYKHAFTHVTEHDTYCGPCRCVIHVNCKLYVHVNCMCASFAVVTDVVIVITFDLPCFMRIVYTCTRQVGSLSSPPM